MANSKPLWPTQDGEHQRQELMGEMMQARGWTSPRYRARMAALPCSRRPPNAGFARMKRPAATGSPVKRGRRRKFCPNDALFSTGLRD